VNSFEVKIIEGIQKISSPVLDWFFRFVTLAGDFAAVLFIFAFLLIFFGAFKATKYAVIVGVTSLLGQILKFSIKRPRPYKFSNSIDNINITSTNELASFPSGHTLMITVTAIFLCALFMKLVRNWWVRGVIIAAFSVLVLLVGFSRMYLGVHYLSDVLGAMLLAALVYVITSYVYGKVWKSICKRIAKQKACASSSAR